MVNLGIIPVKIHFFSKWYSWSLRVCSITIVLVLSYKQGQYTMCPQKWIGFFQLHQSALPQTAGIPCPCPTSSRQNWIGFEPTCRWHPSYQIPRGFVLPDTALPMGSSSHLSHMCPVEPHKFLWRLLVSVSGLCIKCIKILNILAVWLWASLSSSAKWSDHAHLQGCCQD